MDINEKDLQERYHALSTEALLAIGLDSQLTELAERLLEEELSTRDVTPTDLALARESKAVIEADRESLQRDFSTWIVLIVLIPLVVVAVVSSGAIGWIAALLMIVVLIVWFWGWSANALPPATLVAADYLQASEETDDLEEIDPEEDDLTRVPEIETGDDYVKWFYRQPDPSKATDYLEEFVSELPEEPQPASTWPTMFFLYRVASIYPEVVSEYQSVLEHIEDDLARSWIRTLIHVVSGGEPLNAEYPLDPRFPNSSSVLDREIQSGTDLDYLWTEYFVTGNERALYRLIKVLEWPDRVRFKLESWLRAERPTFQALLAHWKIRSLRRQEGIEVDPRSRSIATSGDLDTWLSLDASLDIKSRLGRLPMPMTTEDVHYVSIKAAAKWSLAGMCREHEDVRRICKSFKPELLTEFGVAADCGASPNDEAGTGQSSFTVRVASNSVYHGPPLFELVGARSHALETAFCLVVLLTTLDYGHAVVVWLFWVTEEWSVASVALSICLLLVGTVIGVLRQSSARLLSQSGAMVVVNDAGLPQFLYLGDVPSISWQRSPWVRALTWCLVTVTSVLGSLIAAILLEISVQGVAWELSFSIILILRWFVSWLPTRTVSNMPFDTDNTPPSV